MTQSQYPPEETPGQAALFLSGALRYQAEGQRAIDDLRRALRRVSRRFPDAEAVALEAIRLELRAVTEQTQRAPAAERESLAEQTMREVIEAVREAEGLGQPLRSVNEIARALNRRRTLVGEAVHAAREAGAIDRAPFGYVIPFRDGVPERVGSKF